MTIDSSRQRLRFETEEAVIRAVRARAGMDGVDPSDIINQALEAFLPKELAEVRARMEQASHAAGGDTGKAKRRRKEEA